MTANAPRQSRFPLIPLRRLAYILNGGTPTANEENWLPEVPWATPVDLGGVDGGTLLETERSISLQGLASGSTLVPKDSILLSSRAPIGYVAVTSRETAFNQGCKGLVPIGDTCPGFLRYALVWASDELQSRGQGSTFLEISGSARAGIPIPRPNQVQQRQIDEFLGYETEEIDAFIADQKRLIELLSERRQAVIGRTLDLVGGPHVRLKDLGARKRSGVSVNGSAADAATDHSEFGVLRTGAASKGYFDPTENKLVDDPYEIDRLSTPVIADSLLVNRANTPDLVGRMVYVDRNYPNLYLSDLLWLVTVKLVSARYLGWWAQSRRFRDQVSLIRVGASPTMQKVRYSDFANLTLTLPSPDEQDRICIELARSVKGLFELERGLAPPVHAADLCGRVTAMWLRIRRS